MLYKHTYDPSSLDTSPHSFPYKNVQSIQRSNSMFPFVDRIHDDIQICLQLFQLAHCRIIDARH